MPVGWLPWAGSWVLGLQGASFFVLHGLASRRPYFLSTHKGRRLQPNLCRCTQQVTHSQDQVLFQLVSSSHQMAKVLEFQLQHQSFQRIGCALTRARHQAATLPGSSLCLPAGSKLCLRSELLDSCLPFGSTEEGRILSDWSLPLFLGHRICCRGPEKGAKMKAAVLPLVGVT